MYRKEWSCLPSKWIEDGGLINFSWQNGQSNNTAAFMVLIVLSHNADDDGCAKLTYEQICEYADISRAKVAAGIKLLKKNDIISTWVDGKRSAFKLNNYKISGEWCKIPCKPMYESDCVGAFRYFTLRNKTEYNALRLYLLFAARRDRQRNHAYITYDDICAYTNIRKNDIKAATSFLSSSSLVYTERVKSFKSEDGFANAYRLVGLDSWNNSAVFEQN